MTLGAIFLDVLERFERVGWNTPIRPDHVSVPRVPVNGVQRAMEFLFVFVLAFGAFSVLPSTSIATQREHAGEHVSPPMFGAYSAADGALVFATVMLPTAQGVMLRRAPWLPWYRNALLFCAMLAVIPAGAIANRRRSIPKKYRGTKRNAEWSTLNDLVRAKLLGHSEPGIVVGAVTPPPLFGIIKRKPKMLVDANPAHVLMLAASRSGKDVGCILPTIATAGPMSLFVNDNKGEQYLLTSGLCKEYYGKDVFRLAFQSAEVGEEFVRRDGKRVVERFGSSKHNLFDEIPWGTEREYSSVLQVITTMVARDLKQLDGEDGHWYRTSRVLGTALAYKTMYDPLETLKSPSRVAMLLAGDEAQSPSSREMKKNASTDGDEPESIHELIEHYLGFSATGQGTRPAWMRRSVESLREQSKAKLDAERAKIGVAISQAQYEMLEREERRAVEARIAQLEASMVHPDMERAIRNTMRISGDEASSVYSTINAALTPWLDPNVIRNTRTSTMSVLGMNNGPAPAVTYLVNPPDYGDMFYPIYRTWLDLAIRIQLSMMDQDPETKRVERPHKWPMVWIFNEPMTMGEIPVIRPALPFCASYGHRFLFPFQLASQLRDLYGENEPISGNCFTTIYHAPNDPKEQRDISEMLGERMILLEDRSVVGFGVSVNNSTRTLRPDTVPLMSPQDVGRMPNDPLFVEERDPRSGAKRPKTNPDGSLRVRKQAHQILRTRTGYAYTRKLQWFTDEFPSLYKLVKKYGAVLPTQRT